MLRQAQQSGKAVKVGEKAPAFESVDGGHGRVVEVSAEAGDNSLLIVNGTVTLGGLVTRLVAGFDSACSWYETFFGRPADRRRAARRFAPLR